MIVSFCSVVEVIGAFCSSSSSLLDRLHGRDFVIDFPAVDGCRGQALLTAASCTCTFFWPRAKPRVHCARQPRDTPRDTPGVNNTLELYLSRAYLPTYLDRRVQTRVRDRPVRTVRYLRAYSIPIWTLNTHTHTSRFVSFVIKELFCNTSTSLSSSIE